MVGSPVKLENDGDSLALVREMIERRGEGTVRIAKVKGHADEEIVRGWQVRELDRVGNNRVDEAADFGRPRVDDRQKLSGVCRSWYPVVQELHRFSLPSLVPW